MAHTPSLMHVVVPTQKSKVSQSTHEHGSSGPHMPSISQGTQNAVPWQSTQSHVSVFLSQMPSGTPPEHAATLSAQSGCVQQSGHVQPSWNESHFPSSLQLSFAGSAQ